MKFSLYLSAFALLFSTCGLNVQKATQEREAKEKLVNEQAARAKTSADEIKRKQKQKQYAIALGEANKAFTEKDMTKAYVKYNEAKSLGALDVRQTKNLVAAACIKGKQWEISEKYTEANTAFDIALQNDPNNAEANAGKARLELLKDKIELAAATAPPVPSSDPDAWFEDIEPERVFNDIFTYNEQVFKRKVNNCEIIDKEATCASKGDGFIVTCNGAPQKFKWFKFNSSAGPIISVYTLPMDYTNYNCNPAMDQDLKLFPREKTGTSWKCEYC